MKLLLIAGISVIIIGGLVTAANAFHLFTTPRPQPTCVLVYRFEHINGSFGYGRRETAMPPEITEARMAGFDAVILAEHPEFKRVFIINVIRP